MTANVSRGSAEMSAGNFDQYLQWKGSFLIQILYKQVVACYEYFRNAFQRRGTLGVIGRDDARQR